MKKVRLLLLPILFALALAIFGSAAGTPMEVLGPQGEYQTQPVRTVSLVLDGVPLKTDVPAFILGGRTLVPVRVVSERLGALVNWKEDTMQVQIENGTKAITLTVGSAEATVNGKTIRLPDGVAPTLAKSGGQSPRTMVPLRFVSEQLGASVSFDDAAGTVSIVTASMPTYQVAAPTVEGELVRIQTDKGVRAKIFSMPGKVVLDFPSGVFSGSNYGKLPVGGTLIAQVRYNQFDDGLGGTPVARVVLDLQPGFETKDVAVVQGSGIVTAGKPDEVPAPEPEPAPVAPPEEKPEEPKPEEPKPEEPAKPVKPETPLPVTPPQTGPVVPEAPAESEPPLVVLDAGHGGDDPGAIQMGYNEKDLVLPIALEAGKALEAAGVRVAYTRDADATVSLADRVQTADAYGAALFVSIHANAYTLKPALNGVETYCFERGGASETLAASVHKAVLAATGAADHGQRTANYYVLRNATMPAILLETGYMTNEAECAKLIDPAYRSSIASGLAAGILNYLDGVR